MHHVWKPHRFLIKTSHLVHEKTQEAKSQNAATCRNQRAASLIPAGDHLRFYFMVITLNNNIQQEYDINNASLSQGEKLQTSSAASLFASFDVMFPESFIIRENFMTFACLKHLSFLIINIFFCISKLSICWIRFLNPRECEDFKDAAARMPLACLRRFRRIWWKVTADTKDEMAHFCFLTEKTRQETPLVPPPATLYIHVLWQNY